MTNRKILRWTREERNAVVAEMHHMQNKCELPLRREEAVRKAQLILPMDRRYAFLHSAFMCDLYKRLNAAIASGNIPARFTRVPEIDDRLVEAAKAEPVRDQVPNVEEPVNNFPTIITVEKPVYIKETVDYGIIPTGTLVRILCERVMELEDMVAGFQQLTEKIRDNHRVERTYDRRLDVRPNPPQPVQEAFRVVIIGFNTQQFAEVEAKTANISCPLKLTLIQTDGIKMGELPRFVDHAIVTKFSRHQHWDKVRDTLPKDCVSFVDGGVSEVVQKIFDLTSRQKPTNGVH